MTARKYIYTDPNGWRVEIVRRDVRLRKFFPAHGDFAGALARAQAFRDQFLRVQGAAQPRSNTGVSGITELTHWTRSFPQPCFVVTVGVPGPDWRHRFYYRTAAERQQAFRAAVADRARRAGEDAAALLEAGTLALGFTICDWPKPARPAAWQRRTGGRKPGAPVICKSPLVNRKS